MPRRSTCGPRSRNCAGQPGLPQVRRLDDVVVDADDLRERRGAAEPRCGVVDEVGHGCSSVAAKGTSGANDSSSDRTDALVTGPDPQHHLSDTEPGVVLELALVRDGAEGDDGERGGVAPGLLGQRVQARDGRAQAAAADGDPAVGALDNGGEHRLVGAAADEGADPRLLHRLGPGPRRAEVDELAVVLGLVGRPDGLHGGQVLAHDVVAAGPVDAVVLGLGAVPAEPDAERDPPAGEVVERRHLLGEQERFVLRDEQDAGAEPDARRSPRRPWRARPAGRGSACSRRGARRRPVPGVCPPRRGDACARAGRASRSRAPRPRRPGRPGSGRRRSGRR